MAALGWLVNLDYAASGAVGATTTRHRHLMRNVRTMHYAPPFGALLAWLVW